MGVQVEVQPQIKLTLTQTGLLIEDAEEFNTARSVTRNGCRRGRVMGGGLIDNALFSVA
jgi:hypothetical protein